MKRTMRTLVLLVVLLVVLALPMLACSESSGLEPPPDTVNERGALYSIKLARCERMCGGELDCVHRCVNQP
jgi:hypothetical protein